MCKSNENFPKPGAPKDSMGTSADRLFIRECQIEAFGNQLDALSSARLEDLSHYHHVIALMECQLGRVKQGAYGQVCPLQVDSTEECLKTLKQYVAEEEAMMELDFNPNAA